MMKWAVALLALAVGAAAQDNVSPAPAVGAAASPDSTPRVVISDSASATVVPSTAAMPSATASATPSVTPSAMPAAEPSATPGPAETPAASPGSSPKPSLLKKNGVKLQFLPPPMEGTISLGIYNRSGRRVRTLHSEAGGDEFVAALDGYITHWDGLDDAGNPAPAGHYTASGYMVGNAVTIKPAAQVTGSAAATLEEALPGLAFPNGKAFAAQEKVRLGLVGESAGSRPGGEAIVGVGFDAKGSWLQLADGLPLKQISATPNLKWAAMGRAGAGEPLVVFQSDGTTLEEYVITKGSNMMAFDCGEFEFNEGEIGPIRPMGPRGPAAGAV